MALSVEVQIFFYRAFGESSEGFDELLTRPHHFIFNREWYEFGGGKSEFEDYRIQMKSLSNSEKEELNCELSKTTAGNFDKIIDIWASTILCLNTKFSIKFLINFFLNEILFP